MTVAVLCSGQGPQRPAMFALTEEQPEAAMLFAHEANVLAGDPRILIRTATFEAIHKNRTGQILCALQALAATAVCRAPVRVNDFDTAGIGV
jgi:[acyl-carrier-protein] S-malonyltransferase